MLHTKHMRSYASSVFLIAVVFGLSTISAFGQGGWFVREAATSEDLVGVYFTSEKRGWIAGDNGFLASTTDSGQTWNRVSLSTTDDINEIYFRNNDVGYLVAGRRLIFTRDGGKNWQETRIYRTGEFGTGRPEFLSIRFTDKKIGFVIGSVLRSDGDDDIVVDSLIMRTDDEGDTWQRISVPVKTELIHIDFVNKDRGWIVGAGGVILVTTDSGRTWRQQSSGTNATLFNIDFYNDKEGYAVGEKGTILRTENGGSFWSAVTTNFRETMTRIKFTDDKTGWIVGHSGLLLRTGDKGKTWVRQESNSRERFYGLFMDKRYGWAVGAKGAMLQFRR